MNKQFLSKTFAIFLALSFVLSNSLMLMPQRVQALPDDGGNKIEIGCIDNDGDGYYGYDEINCLGGDDCDDADADEYPGQTWYIDADQDGYGDSAVSLVQCERPIGYVLDNTDCDDGDDTIYPGADEIPDDGIDQNCDGLDSVAPICGNGTYEPPAEQCDNGEANVDGAAPVWGMNPGDGYRQYCSTQCQIYPVPGIYCGDGTINGPEECDNGERNGWECIYTYGDANGCTACSATCTSVVYSAYCGDGILQEAEEECDDGNNNNGDGCSASCQLEQVNGDEPDSTFHFIKVECPAWTDIVGNGDAHNLDATNGQYVNFSNYSDSEPYFSNHYASKPINPSEIPEACQRADGWQFILSLDEAQTQQVSYMGFTDENGEYSINFSQLTQEQKNQLINGGSLWISEDLSTKPNEAEFAAFRCYQDALNGDNLEYINLGGNSSTWPSDVYCIAYNVLEEPEISTTIYAHKVVCEDESYLPNWGAIKSLGNPITADTAQNFLTQVNEEADREVCWLEEGWNFQWAASNITKPDDNVEDAGSEWNTFGPTDSNGMTSATVADLSSIGSHFWMREMIKDGYVPFSGTANTKNHDNVSAEFYCHIDVLNYDNYERIDGPQLGEPYYCVGFNSLIEQQQETGSIAGYKVNDLDGDGFYDSCGPNGDEAFGMVNWKIYLDLNENNQFDEGEPFQMTDSGGFYRFENVNVGGYQICEVMQSGWTSDNPVCQPVNVQQDVEHQYDQEARADFFNYSTIGSITIYKYYDLNGDGEWDDGEQSLSGWEVWISADGYQYQGPDPITDSEGKFVFNNLQAGDYYVCEVLQDGWENTQPGYEAIDWSTIGEGPMVVCYDQVVLGEGEDLDVYFGNRQITPTGSIEICKYEDNGVIGQYEEGIDLPLESWEMRVYNNDDYDELHYTEANGCVSISDLDFDSYTVAEDLPSGWSQMHPSNGNGNQSQTVDLESDNPSQSVYFLNYYQTSQIPIMYACNSSTLQCAIGDGPFASLQGCQDACGASAGSGGGQYVTSPGIVAGAATEKGEVAGASTSCGLYLLKYIKYGANNDLEEVKKLQSFLNEYLGLNLELSGIYDQVTYEAVERFQLLLRNEILSPWVEVDCLSSEDIATGYVYRTTQRAINNIMCSSLGLSLPNLSDEQCFGAIFIGSEEEGLVAGAATSTFNETTGETEETTTTTVPDETIGDTTTTVPGEDGNGQPQNWILVLIGFLVIGGVIYLVYQSRKK